MQKLQELKFYCPLTIRREPDYDEEYDYSEEYPEISPFAAAGYADTVQKRLETYCSDDGKRGLMEYYDRDKSVSEKVYSAVLSVTVRDGELVGMYTCQVHGELNAIIDRFPLYYERYIEVFGGAGWVLFRKPPGLDMEVWNDRNSNLTNLYRCVREQPELLKEKLRYCLNSREDFEILSELHRKQALSLFPDVERAAKFYQLIRLSYASCLESYAAQPHSFWHDFPQIDLANRRLQRTSKTAEDRTAVKLAPACRVQGGQPWSPSADGETPCAILQARGERDRKMRQHFSGEANKTASPCLPLSVAKS